MFTDQLLHDCIQPLPSVCALDEHCGTGSLDLFRFSSVEDTLRPSIFWFSSGMNVSDLASAGCMYCTLFAT
jgi:hypothetical protein